MEAKVNCSARLLRSGKHLENRCLRYAFDRTSDRSPAFTHFTDSSSMTPARPMSSRLRATNEEDLLAKSASRSHVHGLPVATPDILFDELTLYLVHGCLHLAGFDGPLREGHCSDAAGRTVDHGTPSFKRTHPSLRDERVSPFGHNPGSLLLPDTRALELER